jgi:threonine dehydratase
VGAAIKDVFEDTRNIVEPAGALAVAGLKAYAARDPRPGRTFVAVASGANMDFNRLGFVAERAEEHETLFAVTIPEERGAFRRFSELVGARPITEFNYRISAADEAHVFVGVGTLDRTDSTAIAQGFIDAGFATVDLTHDELAKEHVRHMVGGRTALAEDERLFRCLFPERPGALMRFLARMRSDWNISLFHYRNQGSDYGRVLVGLQVPPSDDEAWRRRTTPSTACSCAERRAPTVRRPCSPGGVRTSSVGTSGMPEKGPDGSWWFDRTSPRVGEVR